MARKLIRNKLNYFKYNIYNLNFIKMKKGLLFLLSLSMSYYLVAQEPVRQMEIGLVSKGLNNFGLTFKTGTEKSLWRFNTLFISGNNMSYTTDSVTRSQGGIEYGIKIGKEYRKDLFNNLELRFGADLSFSYEKRNNEFLYEMINITDVKYTSTSYIPGINLVFGLNYEISDNFVFGAEILPGFSYTSGTHVSKGLPNANVEDLKTNISGYSFGLSNNSVLLTLAYRFKM